MTTTDTIYLVKELAICQYVIIIHSPHLCGLPGFKGESKDVEAAPIRCRQVIGDEEMKAWTRTGDDRGSRPSGMEGETKRIEPPAAKEVEQEKKQVEMAIIDDATLRSMLRKAFDMLEGKKNADAGEVDEDEEDGAVVDDVVFLSWEENEDGEAILIDADLVIPGGQAEGRGQLGDEEREMLRRVVQDYLGSEGDEGDGEDVEEVDDEIASRPRLREEL
ncbi:hypothetical protein P7C73_g3263, partial [Tremellales sp. Uapishka_1]